MPSSALSRDREQLFGLLKADAFVKGKVVLSSGQESDHYFDARLVTLSAAGAYHTGCIILDMVKEDALDAIGGPTLGADPMVGAIACLSHEQGRPLNTFIIRKSPKTHGKQQQVEGPRLRRGARVVLIDDVATTGKALVESIEVLSRMDVKVIKAICVIDRQEGAGAALAKYGVALQPIFTADEFLK